jgi:hypothetical protein
MPNCRIRIQRHGVDFAEFPNGHKQKYDRNRPRTHDDGLGNEVRSGRSKSTVSSNFRESGG